MKYQCDNAEEVVKEMFWLAWQACSGPLGMGILQNNPEAGRDDVWKNVQTSGDYVGSLLDSRPGRAYGDYVFGRMMKVGAEYGSDWIELREEAPRPDYQAWCLTYPTYGALYDAAVASLGKRA